MTCRAAKQRRHTTRHRLNGVRTLSDVAEILAARFTICCVRLHDLCVFLCVSLLKLFTLPTGCCQRTFQICLLTVSLHAINTIAAWNYLIGRWNPIGVSCEYRQLRRSPALRRPRSTQPSHLHQACHPPWAKFLPDARAHLACADSTDSRDRSHRQASADCVGHSLFQSLFRSRWPRPGSASTSSSAASGLHLLESPGVSGLEHCVSPCYLRCRLRQQPYCRKGSPPAVPELH